MKNMPTMFIILLAVAVFIVTALVIRVIAGKRASPSTATGGKKYLFIAILAAVVFVVAVIASRKISGGDKTFFKVAAALKTNSFLLDRVGSPVRDVEQNDGPSEVSLGDSGRRHGYYSIEADGAKAKESFKVYWRELPEGTVEIYAIYKTAPLKSDELLWGQPKPELN